MADDFNKGSMPRWQQNELNKSFGNQNEAANTSKIFGPYSAALGTALPTANLAAASMKPEQRCSPVNFHGKSPGIASIYANCTFPIHRRLIMEWTLIVWIKGASGTSRGTSKLSNGGDGGVGGDRFIPNRISLIFDSNHYKVNWLHFRFSSFKERELECRQPNSVGFYLEFVGGSNTTTERR